MTGNECIDHQRSAAPSGLFLYFYFFPSSRSSRESNSSEISRTGLLRVCRVIFMRAWRLRVPSKTYPFLYARREFGTDGGKKKTENEPFRSYVFGTLAPKTIAFRACGWLSRAINENRKSNHVRLYYSLHVFRFPTFE